jgi:hypothetical protein
VEFVFFIWVETNRQDLELGKLVECKACENAQALELLESQSPSAIRNGMCVTVSEDCYEEQITEKMGLPSYTDFGALAAAAAWLRC